MEQPTTPILAIQAVEKAFPGRVALRGVSLSVQRGEIVVLLGPSGCGKTTLLRLIAGLERPDAGHIQWQGTDLNAIPVHKRGFGMVFQDYALFPHKNVADNVRFGLRMHNWPAAKQESRLQEVLDLVGLTGFAGRAVYDLSGGEQQRVALARALAPAPQLLLLDEPLGALDRAMRERLMVEVRDILKHAGRNLDSITAIYVTHDQEEAFAIADRVVVLNEGLVEQIDTPQALYQRPATAFVAHFLGMGNVLPGRIARRDPLQIQTPAGLLLSRDPLPDERNEVAVLIRPESGRPVRDAGTAPGRIPGRVLSVSFRGRFQQVTYGVGEDNLPLTFDLPGREQYFSVGEEITMEIDPAGVCLLKTP